MLLKLTLNAICWIVLLTYCLPLCFAQTPPKEAGRTSPPVPTEEVWKKRVDAAKHVLLVCLYERKEVAEPNTKAYASEHYKGTIVQVFKGSGIVGDRITYNFLVERTTGAKRAVQFEPGELYFVFVEGDLVGNIFLETGSGWMFSTKVLGVAERIAGQGKR